MRTVTKAKPGTLGLIGGADQMRSMCNAAISRKGCRRSCSWRRTVLGFAASDARQSAHLINKRVEHPGEDAFRYAPWRYGVVGRR